MTINVYCVLIQERKRIYKRPFLTLATVLLGLCKTLDKKHRTDNIHYISYALFKQTGSF